MVPQLGRVPTALAKAIAASHFKVRLMVSMGVLLSPWRTAWGGRNSAVDGTQEALDRRSALGDLGFANRRATKAARRRRSYRFVLRWSRDALGLGPRTR